MVEWFLREVNFWENLRVHPLIRKTVDWGNTRKNCRRLNIYKKFQEKILEILSRQINIEDVIEIKNLLSDLKDKTMDYIVRQVGNTSQGLRHIHAPGSVAKKEGRNLYFGEEFTQETLYKLASRLCNSIALGDNIGIYSEDKDFMRELKQLASIDFGYPFKIELEELNIASYETEHPYIVFLKFILWLRERFEAEEDSGKKDSLLLILDRLKSSSISLFFMPTKKEKWRTISLPRLDLFINKWIQHEERRKGIRTFIDNIDNFLEVVLKESKRIKEYRKVRNLIDLLMDNYDTFCHELIEHGVPDFHAVRRMMDIILDLSTRYNVKLHFKPLMIVTEHWIF